MDLVNFPGGKIIVFFKVCCPKTLGKSGVSYSGADPRFQERGGGGLNKGEGLHYEAMQYIQFYSI